MQQQQPKNYTKIGENLHARMEKNSELLALTYGSLVTQLLKDYEDIAAVNQQLDKMGANMGGRLVEEFLAKSGLGACDDFKETVEVLSKVALKMFLGVTAEATDWSADGTACTLVLSNNPLNEFVELPPSMVGTLNYSSLLCGIIRGALEQLYMRVTCSFVKDVLNGDETSEIRLELKELLRDEFFDDEDEDSGA